MLRFATREGARLKTRLTYVPGFIGQLEYRGSKAPSPRIRRLLIARCLVLHAAAAGREAEVRLVASSGDPAFDTLTLGQARLLAEQLNEFGAPVEDQRSVWTFAGGEEPGSLRVRLEAFYVGHRPRGE